MLTKLYAALLSKRESFISENDSPLLLVRIKSFADLHFLDWQACRLLKACDVEVVLRFDVKPPPHEAARIAANLDEESKAVKQGVARSDFIVYERGAILERFLRVRGWSQVWHEYLTSRDAELLPRAANAGATLPLQVPHLRAGFVTGADLFHQGSYYRAHEDWESLWMRLDGEDEQTERALAQALIQLSGAHLHRLKGRARQARKLFASPLKHFALAEKSAWLDVPQLVSEAGTVFKNCDEMSAANDDTKIPSLPFRHTHTNIARKHL